MLSVHSPNSLKTSLTDKEFKFKVKIQATNSDGPFICTGHSFLNFLISSLCDGCFVARRTKHFYFLQMTPRFSWEEPERHCLSGARNDPHPPPLPSWPFCLLHSSETFTAGTGDEHSSQTAALRPGLFPGGKLVKEVSC